MHTYWTSMFWWIDSRQNRVPADWYDLNVSRAQVPTHRGQVFFWNYPLTSKLVFKWSQAQVKNVLCLCAAQLNWLQTDLGRENSASCYRQGRQLLLTFLTMVARWSRSTCNFYVLIGQNLTGEFMRKIYAASWILFTLTAEANKGLCRLVMFLTVFFHWTYKMKFSWYQEHTCQLSRFSRESASFSSNLPISRLEHQISRIKWTFEHFCALVWNLVHFITKLELLLFIVQFLGHFCTCLVNDKD